MKKGIESTGPLARKEGLLVQELSDEVLVYDLFRDKALCLNQTAALIWNYCDGQTNVETMALLLNQELKTPVDERVVWFALSQLNNDHLLAEPIVPPPMMAGLTRRQLMRTLGVVVIASIPLLTSIVAPTPAQASTCLPTGAPCATSAQCCSGLCNGPPTGCS